MKRLLCRMFGHVARGPVEKELQLIDDYTFYRCERCERLIFFVPRKGWKVWEVMDVEENHKRLIHFVEEKIGPIEYRSDFAAFSNGDVEGWFRVQGTWHHVKMKQEVFAVDGVVFMDRQ